MTTDFELWAAELAAHEPELEQPVTGRLCVCGCVEDNHEHHRAGSDCGKCGRFACPHFRPARTVNVTITIGWVLILAAVVTFWVAVGWVAVHIIQWLGA